MAEAENPTQPLPLAGTFDGTDSEDEKAAASQAFQRHTPLDLGTLQRVLDGLRRTIVRPNYVRRQMRWPWRARLSSLQLSQCVITATPRGDSNER
jgi:hypothetical protein